MPINNSKNKNKIKILRLLITIVKNPQQSIMRVV